MTVWCHLITILKQPYGLRKAGLVSLLVALITTLIFATQHPIAHAASGINKTLNFQARLLTSAGGVVPDGHYNVQFKIYQDGAGTAAGNAGGTLKWTETYINNGGTSGVEVRNGFLTVTLGSQTPFGTSVDWNQDTLWLSMNIAGSASACTTFGTAPCTADGEMVPMKRISAVPYAINSEQLGGKTVSDFLQNIASLQTGSLSLSGSITSGTSLLSSLIDAASAGSLGIGTTNATSLTLGNGSATTTIQGNLIATNLDSTSATSLSIGTANATSIDLGQNVAVASGKSLTLAGGNTASRPASPSEGMLYYDTSTKQLLTYANGKWQGDRSTASKIVAASNSSQAEKDAADYVADGTGDQTEINSALTAAAGGKVYLIEGTYTLSGSVQIPDNTTLAGAGSGTVITIPNSFNTSIDAITTSGSKGITIQDLRLDGNKTNQTSGTMNGIYMYGVGSGTGSSAVPGGKVLNVESNKWSDQGIYFNYSANSTVTSSTAQANGQSGIKIANGNNNTVTGSTTQGNSVTGIDLSSTSYNTITGNTSQGNTSTGLNSTSGSHNTITGNTFQGNSSYGLGLSSSSSSTITGNTFQGNNKGIDVYASSDNSIIGNTFTANTSYAIQLTSSSQNMINNNTMSSNPWGAIFIGSASNNNIASGNKVTDSGGTNNNEGIVVSASDNNQITNNNITDSLATSSNYAIAIYNSSSDTNYIGGNTLGGGSIYDAGTGTIFAGQTDDSSNFTVKTAGAVELVGNTNVTGILSSTGGILAPSIDTASAGTLTLGANNATGISLAEDTTVASGKTFTINGVTTVKTSNATALLIENASNTALLTADTSSMQVVIGTTSNGIILSASGIQLNGTAQGTKTILLTPEFTGAVLDSQSDTPCISAYNGTMTASYDITNRTNYYNWQSTSGTAQCYDVVVQVPIPNDFSSWSGTPDIQMKKDATGTGAYAIQITPSTGTDANYNSYTSPGTLTTSWSNVATSSLSGTYTAGDYMTIKIRLSSTSSANVKLGNIKLVYKSKS